ncbi:MAG: cardiolipin synthase [Opitutus sp.]|nr:cardiolipin synthase [Opitutus sp.]
MDPTLNQAVDTAKEHPWILGLLPHLLTVVGFLLAVFAIARLMSERKQPGHTFAWLLSFVFIPWLSVPLFLIFGGRKLRRLAAQKARLCPVVPGAPPSTAADSFAARVLTLNGACPPVGGNRVEFVTSGEDAYHRLEHSIREAKHTIHLMTFILSRDAVGRRLVKLLAHRARDGVKVRLLLDSLGCFMSKGRFCDPIREAGGEVVAFMPMMPLQTRGSANLRNHRKIAVFDHRRATLGGRNLAIEYMGPAPLKRRWRDFGAVIEGPAVSLLEEIFLADWAYASGQPIARLHDEIPPGVPEPAGSSEVQIVASGPDVQGDPLYEGILSLVQQAERNIWVVTPYFIPDEVLQRSLIVQARAGIDVRLVVPARSNHPITDLARRHSLRELQRAGVQVLLYGPGMNHAKAILVDEATAVWGSANMDLRSLFVNFEVAAVTYSEADARHMSAWMREVFAHSRPMPAPRKEPGLFPTLGEEIGRLIGPLL